MYESRLILFICIFVLPCFISIYINTNQMDLVFVIVVIFVVAAAVAIAVVATVIVNLAATSLVLCRSLQTVADSVAKREPLTESGETGLAAAAAAACSTAVQAWGLLGVTSRRKQEGEWDPGVSWQWKVCRPLDLQPEEQ